MRPRALDAAAERADKTSMDQALPDTGTPETGTSDAVRWAYRLLLGRDAESAAVVGAWARITDTRVIRDHFLASDEFQAQLAAGFPPLGPWIDGPLTADAATAAHALIHGVPPAPAELAATLARHPDLASFRDEFLGILAPGIELAGRPVVLQDHEFTFLDRRFTLRGKPSEDYWRMLVTVGPEPGVDRMARVVRAAFPDGGKGRVLVDAGANIGMTSIALAAGAPDHAALLCFEPDPRCAALLRHNMEANGLTAARCFGMALGGHDGTARMRQANANSATNLILSEESRVQRAGAQVVDVPIRRLDGVLAEQGIDRLDFLKIDVEGAEALVMQGAAEAIAKHRPFVFVEFNLWTQMTVAARNPMDVLAEWRAAYKHMVVFNDLGRPFAIHDNDGLLWVLHSALTRRGGLDDLILCDRLDWLKHWA